MDPADLEPAAMRQAGGVTHNDRAWTPPRLPVSAGAIVLDEAGGLLILRPTYKSGWTIPGGIVEEDGESPWDACRREVAEETGLTVATGRLVCVDTRPGKKGRPLGLRFLFHCGVLPGEQTRHVRLQASEASEFAFLPPVQALTMLRAPVARRVRVGLEAAACVYLEDGHPVPGVVG